MLKSGRICELLLALVILAVLAIPGLIVSLLIVSDSPGPIFFRHLRAGQGGKPFEVLKFRTMVPDADKIGGALTYAGDPRVTRVGRWLRHWKIDEWPQIINVLKGEMAIIGPRPEALRYIPYYPAEYSSVLSLKPGITDPSSIEFIDEERILAAAGDQREEVYIHEVLPQKLARAQEYASTKSWRTDLKVMWLTFAAIWRPSHVRKESDLN